MAPHPDPPPSPPTPPAPPIPEHDDDDCRLLTATEVAEIKRREAEEAQRLIEGNEEAVRQQRREAEARPVRMYDDVPCIMPDMYKCPRCNFHNFYLRTMCNKLRCGNCDKPFCIVCLHPSSTMSHLADHAGCARLFALSR